MLRFRLRFTTLVLGAILFATPSVSRAQTLDWNAQTQGEFVFALAQGADGFWVGTENQGVWRRDAGGKWRNFTRADGLGDDTILSLARRGSQIWAGHANGGLSVWDGARWTNLGVEDGLPSERVTALFVDEANSVWIGTENGLLQFSDANGWFIPDSPLCKRSIAGVSSAGNLVVAATSSEGLLVSRDGGQTWEEVRGPQIQPLTPTGAGLPSDVLNDVKIDSLGQIWVATDTGVARSEDAGKSWFYVRGEDWKANIEGSALGLRPQTAASDIELAAEDWVQTLAPTADGKIWLGFRQKGAELRDCRTAEVLFVDEDDRAAARLPEGDWVRSIFPVDETRAITARYAGGVVGLMQTEWPAISAKPDALPLQVPGALPVWNAAQLQKLIEAKTALTEILAPGSAAFESFDWRTQGDWVGRYGDRFAQDPIDNVYNRTVGASFDVRLGTHVNPEVGGPYTYYVPTGLDDRRAPYFPSAGQRRLIELNDGTWRGEYSFAWEGPGLWALAEVPPGAHRMSFYFVNNDGRTQGLPRYRDYVVSLRAYTPELEDAEQAPDLARARIRDASGGGYARFSVVGPAKFWLKIARHRSNATKVNGLYLDFISEAPQVAAELTPEMELKARLENGPMTWMNDVRYVTEATPKAEAGENETVTLARRAWEAVDESALRVGGLENRFQTRLGIYRAAKEAKAPENLLANWRWKLSLWRDSDREVFDETMKRAWTSEQARRKQQAAEKAAREREKTVVDEAKTVAP